MSETPGTRRRARRRFEVHAILGFAAVLLIALPFAALVVMITARSAPLAHLDQHTAAALHRFAVRHSAFTGAMKTVSRVGSPLGWWVILTPVFGWLLLRRLWRLAAFLAVTAIGSSLLNSVIKSAVDRARPHLVDPVAVAAGKSFPSGHTQAATVGFGILVLVFLPLVPRRGRPWLWAAAVAAVLLIGFSRIALGVHYVSDVLGGLVVGSAWLLAMVAAFSAWRRDLDQQPVHVREGLEPEDRDRLGPTG